VISRSSADLCWSNVRHLSLHVNIYDALLLQTIKENFAHLRSIDYHVPHFSLNPQDHELHQYNIELGWRSSMNANEQQNRFALVSESIKQLLIRDSVRHGCHVPQPLLLLTSKLVELDIEHFYLMQIVSNVGQHTKSHLVTRLAQIRRLTVRQFDERVSNSFFPYFPQLEILILNFITYKMQIYRTKLPFLDHLLHSIPTLISLKFEHVKKPNEYQAFLDLQYTTDEQLSNYFADQIYWSKWYDDRTQKSNRYATFLCSL
jgi:hypothetical protein